MMANNLRILCSIGLLFTLSSCNNWTAGPDEHSSLCRTLKSQIIFSGSTSDTRQADIQNAQKTLSQQAYDRNHCDD